jgi:tetratricopeptide (TPR) repeat protein
MATNHTLNGSFGEVLRTYRKSRRVTQQQLARRLGVHYNTISSWEQGTYLPDTRGVVLELARHLELDQQETRLLLEASLFTLSSYWTIPVPRNPLFTGRELPLQMLHTLLQQKDAVALTQTFALSGLGGIGKTQLVIEYAYRHAEDYHAIFWLNAETQESLLASLSEIGDALRFTHYPEQQQLRHAIKQWLTTHRDWLLIIDNLEDPELVKPLLPAARQGHVLYTTRLPALGMLAQTLEIAPLSDKESLQFLRTRASQVHVDHERQFSVTEEHAASELARLLGGLPLALDQAGAYIEQTRCSLTDFLAMFQRHPLQLLEKREKGAEHPASVVKVFVLSFERLQQCHNAAAELLIYCCFLAPEEIPEALFTQHATLLSSELQTALAEPFTFHEILKNLLSYALVQRHPNRQTLVVHRLVQAVLRAQLSNDQQRERITCLIGLLAQAFPQNPGEPETWPWCEQLLPHIFHCLALTETAESYSPELYFLLSRTATYLFQRAQFTTAESLYQRCLALQTQTYGATHANLIPTLGNLADLKRKQGQYEEADILYQRAISLLNRSPSPDPQQLITLLNGRANSYFEQGHYREVEPLYQQVLALRKQELGPEHTLVAGSLNNLALLYDIQSRYADAEPLFQQVIHMREQILGQEDFSLAPPLTNLARLYLHLGRYTEAEPLFLRAILLCEKARGSEHPDLALLLSNLADLYTEQKRQGEAEAIYLRARSILEQGLGTEHPLIAYTFQGMANLYVDMEKYAEAKTLFLRVLQIWQRTIPEHPERCNAFYGLAHLSFKLGNIAEAERSCLHALSLWQEAFGPEHREVARALHLLGMIKHTLKHDEEAREVLHQALKIYLTLLGPEHPETIAVRRHQAQFRSTSPLL